MISSNKGYFGPYGGTFIPEILYNTMEQLKSTFYEARNNPLFRQEFLELLRTFSGRETPLTFCPNLSTVSGGARIYFKREDLNHGGAHKMNNVLGQGLLVRRMGKKRVIAETGAGQHGVATAIMAARFGFSCTIYMGEVDIERQYPNVFWMKQLGAQVIPVTSGSRTLKDSMDEAFRDWSGSYRDSHYLIGTACGCEPYPEMVAWFQSVIGEELRSQCERDCGALPAAIYACVGGGSNALGAFSAFLDDRDVTLVGVEAGGRGAAPGQHSVRFGNDQGRPGIAQGFHSYFLQDAAGQLQTTHSVAAGLDYVGVSPVIADLVEKGRIRMTQATDVEVVQCFQKVVRKEGIIPALESTHAIAASLREASDYPQDKYVVVNLSGRGDKDIFTIADALGDEEWFAFLQRRRRQ
jgi:tryptophan synthase beta chain